ncbi:MAG: DUF4143 domain-containing protein [Desulfobacula sp.]|nr:hypothetical protein [Desulfobacula sp.]MCD4722600.1 DUF4143 domain-containing protein [Desulfobacula sp.]
MHALLDIETQNDFLDHSVYGPFWESFVIENIISTLPFKVTIRSYIMPHMKKEKFNEYSI